MPKREVIIGKVIAVVVLIATIIIHNFVFKLPHVLATSLAMFSAMLFTLCTIGDIRRRKQDENRN
jgi:Mg/Co/Ni transporter MgtE